jgi:hypothetical protein
VSSLSSPMGSEKWGVLKKAKSIYSHIISIRTGIIHEIPRIHTCGESKMSDWRKKNLDSSERETLFIGSDVTKSEASGFSGSTKLLRSLNGERDWEEKDELWDILCNRHDVKPLFLQESHSMDCGENHNQVGEFSGRLE